MLEKLDIDKKTIKLLLITFTASLLAIGAMFIMNSMAQTNVSSNSDSDDLYQEVASKNMEMVSLSNEVGEDIREINELDEEGRVDDAVELIGEAKQKTALIKNNASDISNGVDDLLATVLGVNPTGDYSNLTQTTDTYLSFVEEFVDYAEDLDNFLTALSTAIQTNDTKDRIKVNQFLSEASRSQARINNIFDELTDN